ncbi:MAG: NAD(P)H-dependent oxidoreductase, partial [Limnobacter sp.]|nr:NAD(P)H-dependent oxidoreductase [Limnobacter sp.]
SMKDRLLAELTEQGHEVVLSDLYAMGFNPVASAKDFPERANEDYLVYAMEQRHAAKNGTLPADIAQELDKVKACDLLILNFPLYWFSVPAILKGWIDRVFLSGVMYGGRNFYDHGRMVGKKAWVTFTLGGRDHMFGPGAVHPPIETVLTPLLRGSLGYVGFDVYEPFAAYHVPYLPQEEREKIMDEFSQAIADLPERRQLTFPKLADFDSQMRPLNH